MDVYVPIGKNDTIFKYRKYHSFLDKMKRKSCKRNCDRKSINMIAAMQQFLKLKNTALKFPLRHFNKHLSLKGSDNIVSTTQPICRIQIQTTFSH